MTDKPSLPTTPVAAAFSPSRPRNHVLDAIKGVAILLVILGHVLQSHLPDSDSNLLYRIIYTFHMPLFIVLSGWTVKPETRGRISKTLMRLIPPTICWYLVQYLVERRYREIGVVPYLRNFLENPEVGLWFLWVLALCIVVLVMCWRLEKKLGLWAYLVGIAVLGILPIHVLGIPLAKYYFPFLLAGYLLSRYRVAERPWVRYVVWLCIPLYVLILPLWHRTYMRTSAMPGYIVYGHPLPMRGVSYLAIRVLAACSGSILAAAATAFLYKSFKLDTLAWLGRNTMEIYVSHQLLIHLFPSQTIVAMILTFLVAAVVPLVLAHLLKKIALLNFFLYGGPWPSGANALKGQV